MSRSRIDVAAIRRNTRRRGGISHPLNRSAELQHYLDASGNGNGESGPALSRRAMLGLAGATLVGASPALKSARALLSDGFRMEGDERRLAFLMGGKERWVIDRDMFSGSPRLSIERTNSEITLKLSGAKRPGTNLSADFTASIRTAVGGSRIDFHGDFGDFSARGSFEKWLLGLEPLRGRVKCGSHHCSLGSSASVRLSGTARATFSPDWSLELEGDDIASLQGLGRSPLTTDSLAFALAAPDDDSLIEGVQGVRSVTTLLRGDKSWPLTPSVTAGSKWDLQVDDNAFDRITIESEQWRGGHSNVVLLADATESKRAVHFKPKGGLSGQYDDPFALPIEYPSLAIDLSDSRQREALVGNYPEKPVTLRTNSVAVKLGEGESGTLFEVRSEGSRVSDFLCAPSIVAASLPLASAVVQPAKPRRETRLNFFRREMRKALRGVDPETPDVPMPDEEDGDVELEDSKEAVVTFPLDSIVWVLRPADMLYLGFEFINLQISTGTGSKGKTKGYAQNNAVLKATQETTTISRIKAAESLSKEIGKISGPAKITPKGSPTINKPYLVVHFPPQNIAEQAYWETDGATALTGGSQADGFDQVPDNMSETNPGVETDGSGNELPNLPPIQHRIAGPSRLAFKLPDSVNELPYTLADLLDWSSLTPSVVPVALPPPPPPSPALGTLLGINKALQNKIASDVAGKSSRKGRISALATRDTKLSVGDRESSGDAAQTISRTSIQKVKVGTGSQAVGNQSLMMTGNASIQADADQIKVLQTENAAAKFDLYLDLKAVSPEIIKPKDHHTALELPYRLILSPHIYSGWAHALEPVTHGNRTELWHTRLGVRKSTGAIDEHDDYYRTVRAVWSYDYLSYKPTGPASNNEPFRMSLNARDRHELVRLSSDFKISGYIPDPVSVQQLILSPLGAWLNSRGAWEPPNDTLSIEEWKHRGTMGRDHYVRVVYKGFLYPFGNRASLIKITERKIKKFGKHGYIAYMYQRMYIVVRKPVMEYPGLSQPYGGRRTPFRRFELKTLITPNLDKPEDAPSKVGSYGDELFWPVVAGKDFQFDAVATDWDGNEVEFSTPLCFVNNKWAFKHDAVDDAAATYSDERRKRETHGATLAYAPSKKIGDTAFETDYVRFGHDRPASNTSTKKDYDAGDFPKLPDSNDAMYDADQPYFYPAFEESRVRIDAVEQINGSAAFQAINIHDTYYKHGIDANENKGQVFASLVDTVEMSFNSNADKAGGIATPNVDISGLSRSLGTVGGKVEEVTQGKFEPTSFFDEALEANLLGGISLRDIIDAVNDFAGDLIKIPRLLNAKNFSNPKEILSTLGDLKNSVEELKDDIEKFDEMKDKLEDAIGDIDDLPSDIESLAESAKQEAEDAIEEARAKALAIIQEVENEVKGILEQAKGYAESVINKVKDIANSDSLGSLLENLGLPTEFTLELKWGPMIKSWPNPSQPNSLMGTNALFQALDNDGNDKVKSDEVVFIRVALTVKLDGSAPSFVLEGVGNNFKIKLIPIDGAAPDGFVHLQLSDLSFHSKDGEKVEVNVEFDVDDGITFAGPLAFVEKIREFIPFDGFSDPPSLDVTPTGIVAGFTFPIPSISVGVFSLQNISLGASLELPFTNSPIIFTFLFCTRENPFVLTVSFLGGGGFFGLIISTREIGVEAALEFGAQVAFDVGVASGGVYVIAGVYFKKMGEECILEGYLNLGGNVSVLGIISISIDLYMSLTYKDPGGKVIGQATLTFEVEVLLFSVSFSKTIERRFKGSENDPLFSDLLTQSDWDEYCNAFAEV